MNRFGTVFGTALGLALLIGLLAGGYFLFEYVVGAFSALDRPVRILAAIGSVVILLSAVIVAEGLKSSPRDTHSAAVRAALYERLLSFCCERVERAQSLRASAACAELVSMERSLVLQGSTKVISTYVKLRRLAMQGGAASETEWALLNSLVAEMRSDLGSSGLARKQSEILDLLRGQSPTVP